MERILILQIEFGDEQIDNRKNVGDVRAEAFDKAHTLPRHCYEEIDSRRRGNKTVDTDALLVIDQSAKLP